MIRAAVSAGIVLLATASAQAQATRTWVSGVGDDANPCSRTAPCKTFAGAISKTAAAGEISVLDPGGFGALTITKSISVVADGVEGGVLVSGTPAITINAGPNDNISLYGLTIEGTGTGTAGIRILQANNVFVSNTVIRGFQGTGGYGVDIEPSNGPRIYLKDVSINTNTTGIYFHSGAVTTGLVMDNCTVSGNISNSYISDTSTSVGRAQASKFANTPIAVSNGAQLISNGNNFFAGGVGPTSVSGLQ